MQEDTTFTPVNSPEHWELLDRFQKTAIARIVAALAYDNISAADLPGFINLLASASLVDPKDADIAIRDAMGLGPSALAEAKECRAGHGSALHCIAMARDAVARSPLKADWTRDAHQWLDGAVSILMGREQE